jgi:hypothetical protein
MATIGGAGTAKTMQRLAGSGGLNESLAALTQPGCQGPAPLGAAQIRAQNVATELAERSMPVQYPVVNVYCEKIVNSLAEKFQMFSGTVQMAVEIRYSQDGLDGLEASLEQYAGAVMHVLDQNRGDWGDGLYYTGGYQVTFGAVKHGGKNFVQMAKVSFELAVGIN